MVKLFFKLFLASIKKDKIFSILNILGLSIGICSCLLIYLWVSDEVSFDHFHKNANKVYRIGKVEKVADSELKSVKTPAFLALELKNNFPQIIKAASIVFEGIDKSISYNNSLSKFNVSYTSNELFEIFDFPIVYKAAESLLINEKSAVISKTTSEKLFGHQNPIGKKIECIYYLTKTYEISAVVDIPANSHLQFEILIPLTTNRNTNSISYERNSIQAVNYIQLSDNSELDEQQKLKLQNFLSEKTGTDIKLFFQPLLDIHLFTDFNDESSINNGNISYVKTFSSAALFLLIITGLNYIILSTARSERRNKEIALRKLFGSNKFLLVGQFLLETILITLIAQLMALILFFLVLPSFNELTGKMIELKFNYINVLYFIISLVLISSLAGFYLSFYLSALKPLSLLKGGALKNPKLHISAILSPIQLIISFIFIICSISIHQQLIYMRNKDSGMKLENILAFSTTGFTYKTDRIKKELLKNANIYSVTASGGPPIDYHFNRSGINWEGKESNDNFSFNIQTVDPSYIETFGIELLQGSLFPQDMTVEDHFSGDYNNNAPIIINETAMHLMGLHNPIGKKIDLGFPVLNGHIIGVVKDFHFQPLNYIVSPMAMGYDPESFLEMFVKINPESMQETIKYIEEVTSTFREGKYPFDYYFVKDKIDNLYKAEKNMSNFSLIFAFISVSIAILGIMGMTSFSLTRRKKSITVRKVYGAETKDIIKMYIIESSIITCIAFIIATVISWNYLQGWLNNYAYHFSLSLNLFIGVFLCVLLLIIFITITLVYGDANKNPIKNLHYE